MKMIKKISAFMLAVSIASIMTINSSAESDYESISNGTIQMQDISTSAQLNNVGLTSTVSSAVISLEGENNSYNFLVPASGSAKIENLPVDVYRIKVKTSGLYTFQKLFSKDLSGCSVSNGVLTVTDENCKITLGFTIQVENHRGYEDVCHSISTPKL